MEKLADSTVEEGDNVKSKETSNDDGFSYHLHNDYFNQVFGTPCVQSNFIHKSLDRVIQEFIRQNSDTENISDWSKALLKGYNEVLSCKAKWGEKTKEGIQSWSRNSNSNLREITEIIAVLDRAHEILNDGKPFTICQIVSLLSLTGPSSASYGRFCEMVPGEGQATIVTMLAILKILMGEATVDIICGTEQIANAAVNKFGDLYALFGVSVAANDMNLNCNDASESKTEIYAAEVIYGTIRSFQLDYLQDISTKSGLRHKRGFGTVIVDDSSGTLFEDFGIVTTLSICLEPSDIFTYIWRNIWRNLSSAESIWVIGAARQITEKNDELIEEAKEGLSREDFTTQYNFNCHAFEMSTFIDLVESTLKLVESGSPEEYVPEHLTEFVKASLEEWIENAIYACYVMQKDVHYRVDKPIGDCPKIIPIYDFITKSRCDFSRKVSELLPFLQLKENLEVQSPTFTSCRISTYGYMQLYAPNITVITETQRSKIERDYIKRIHKLEVVTIPRQVDVNFQELQVRIIPDEHWAKMIAVDVNMRVVQGNQAVLIICKNTADCDDAEHYLKLTSEISFTESTPSLGTIEKIVEENQLDVESDKELSLGEIVIVTDSVARRLRLKLSEALNTNGGLHVCIGFCPTSERQKQLLLHNALKGLQGSGQLILRSSEIQYNSQMYEFGNKDLSFDEDMPDENSSTEFVDESIIPEDIDESDLASAKSNNNCSEALPAEAPKDVATPKPPNDEPLTIFVTLIKTNLEGAPQEEYSNWPIQVDNLNEHDRLVCLKAAPGTIKAYLNRTTGLFSIALKENNDESDAASGKNDVETTEADLLSNYNDAENVQPTSDRQGKDQCSAATVAPHQNHLKFSKLAQLSRFEKYEAFSNSEIDKILKFWGEKKFNFDEYYNAVIKHNEQQRLQNVTLQLEQLLFEDKVFHLFWENCIKQIQKNEDSVCIETLWSTWISSHLKNYYDDESGNNGEDGGYSERVKKASMLFEIFLSLPKCVNMNNVHSVKIQHELHEVPIYIDPAEECSKDIEDGIWGKYGIVGNEVMRKIDDSLWQTPLEDFRTYFPNIFTMTINEHIKFFLDVELVGGASELGQTLINKFQESFEQVWLCCREEILQEVRNKAVAAPEEYLERHQVMPFKKFNSYVSFIEFLIKTQYNVIRNAPEEIRTLSQPALLDRISNYVFTTITYNFLKWKRWEFVEYIPKQPRQNQTDEEREGIEMSQLATALQAKCQFSYDNSKAKLQLAYMMTIEKLKNDLEYLERVENGDDVLRMEDLLALCEYLRCPIILECKEVGMIVKTVSSDVAAGEVVQVTCNTNSSLSQKRREEFQNHFNKASDTIEDTIINCNNDNILEKISKQSGKSSMELRQHLINNLVNELQDCIDWHKNIQLTHPRLLGGTVHTSTSTDHLRTFLEWDDFLHFCNTSAQLEKYIMSMAQAIIFDSENQPGNKQELEGIALENSDKGHALRKHSSHSSGEEFLKKNPNVKKLTTFSNEGSQAKALLSCLKIIPDKHTKIPYSLASDYEIHVRVSALEQTFKMCEFTRDDRKKPKCTESVANYITLVLGYRVWNAKRLLHVQTIFPRMELPENLSAEEVDPYFITKRNLDKNTIYYPGKAKYKVLVKRFFSD